MDSINANQPEDNRKNISHEEAKKRIRDMAEGSSCFFTTAVSSGESGGTRPMSVQQVDEEGNLWFFSASDSHKNHEIAIDPSVRLYFQGSKYSDFLTLNGKATIIHDKAKIKELWEFTIETWFTGGIDDPRVRLIKFVPSEGYYWDTKHGNAVAGIKMLVGATIGKTLDDSIEGKISNVK